MKTARMPWKGRFFGWVGAGLVLLWLANPGGLAPAMAQGASGKGQRGPDVAGGAPEERDRVAWKLLTDAAADPKSTQTRIQALAALGLLRCTRAEKMITDAMAEPDLDVRAAAALAAGQTEDRNRTDRESTRRNSRH